MRLFKNKPAPRVTEVGPSEIHNARVYVNPAHVAEQKNGMTKTFLERAVRARLAQLWDSGTQRSRAETAGFLLAEIDPMLQRWIDEEE